MEDLPNGTADLKVSTASDNLAEETSSEAVGVVSKSRNMSYLSRLVIGIAVCVLLVSIAIALWFGRGGGMQPDVAQNVAPENVDVSFSLTQNVSDGSEKVVEKEENSLHP